MTGYTSQTWIGRGETYLSDEQDEGAVWKNTILCANCKGAWSTHCTVHTIPCCAGHCPAPQPRPGDTA